MTGTDIKSLRFRFCLLQAELAALLGVSQASLCRKENGSRPVTKRDVLQLRQIEARLSATREIEE